MFWRGVLGYLPVNIVQALAGFGTIVVFTRILSPEAYGNYALAFSVAAMVHLVGLTWIEAALARFWAAESPEGRPDLFATLYRAFAVIALAAPIPIAVILALSPISLSLKLAIASALAAAVARSLLKLAQERRRAAGEVRGFAVYDIVQTGGGFGLGAVFAMLGLGAAAPFAGAGAATAVCLLWALRPELALGRGGRFDRARLHRYASYGLPISFSLVLSVALASTDRFVLAGTVGEAAVGAYHAGYSLSSRTLDIIFLWLAMAGSPATVAALEGGGEAALRRTAGHQASLMVLVALPACIGLALVSAPLAHLMVGPRLADQAAAVTPWIAVGALFSGLTTHYLNTAFTLSRRTGRQFIAIAVPALANLGLCLVLIPRWGLAGAAWSTAIAYGLGAATSFLLMRGCLRLPIPWTVIAKAGAATALMALAVTRIPSFGGILELALKAGCGAIVYVLAVVALDAAGVRGLAIRWRQSRRLAPGAAA